MSLDRSLKLKGALTRHRNVLTRGERIDRLKEEERWEEGDSLFGLPKVANRKVSVGKKTKEEKPAVEGEVVAADAAAGTPPAAPPAGAKAAASGSKAAAPGKAAAPQGKAVPTAGGKAAPAKPAAGGKK
jgi:small basic protein (TIGR04137 family)